MKIPLSMFVSEDSLLIYRNGTFDKVEFPIRPFVLVQRDMFPELIGKEEVWHKVPEDEDRTYLRVDFRVPKDVQDFKKRYSHLGRFIFSNNFAEQIYISAENFLLDYPHTNDLTVMFWDIEVASKGDGLFPKALTNEILAIGYSIWKYDNNGAKRKICQKICKGFDPATMSDKPVIDEFLNDVKELDPDVLAGYNTDEFDFPYLIERAKIVGSDLTLLGRGGREPSIWADGDIKVRIPGRIHFDIYKSNSGVMKDQSLFGIKSKTLKDLGRWYKAKRTKLVEDKWIVDEMQDIEVKEHIEDLLKLFKENPELLYAYLDDDIYRTEGVGHVYLRNCMTLAEMMHVPLENIICMYSSLIPKLLVARNMEQLRYINTTSNFNKYNSDIGTVAELGLKYEGAIVGLYKDGYQPSTYKIDFASQYPSSIQTWNLGPDTTFLVRVEEYTGTYNCIVNGNYNWYRVPTYFEDGKYKYDLIVKVRNDKEGFLKQAITKFKAERKKIRQEMKGADEDKYAALYAQQLAIKVIMNSIYGFLGLKTSIYGDMISAAMVTSLCRWCSLKYMQRNEDILIEVDTDGLIINKKVDIDVENAWLQEEILKKFNISDNHMALELEGDGEPSYFYMMKNYIKQKPDGKFEIHGSSFKTSRAAKIVDRAVKLGIEHVFNNKPAQEVFDEAYNFKGLSLEDFTERAKLAKDAIVYEDQLDWRLFLAKQVQLKTGQIITKGTQMNYLVTKDQLPQKEFKKYYRSGKNYTYTSYVTSIKELNINYYTGLVDKALAKFGLSRLKHMQTDLFSIEKKNPIKKSKLDVVPKDKL